MKLKLKDKVIYFCIRCREVHYDRDYCMKSGDILIYDLDKLLKSIYRIKKEKMGE